MVSRQAKDPCFCSPLRSCFEQSDELVWRPEEAFAQMWWNDCLDGFELFCGVATRVDFGGLQITVPEPQAPPQSGRCMVRWDQSADASASSVP
jgi:hypothetical protein